MKSKSALVLEDLRTQLRPASVAQVGGFGPSADPITSWFLQGVSLPGEGLPVWKGHRCFRFFRFVQMSFPWFLNN